MAGGLLSRVQDLELQLSDLRNRCAKLEQEQVQQPRTAIGNLSAELSAQVAELVQQLLAEAEAPVQVPAPKAQARKAGVCFRDRNSTVEIPAVSDLRPTKKRVPTTFAPAGVQPAGLRFDDSHDVEEVKAEADADGEAKLRPTKSRQATCFARPQLDDEDDDRPSNGSSRQVGFADSSSAMEVEAAPGARSVKKRVPTTFVRGAHTGDGVSFDDQVEREEIGVDSGSASTGKVSGMRPTKSRQATCFAPARAQGEEEEEEEEGGEEAEQRPRTVNFGKQASVVEFDSSGRTGRPVKQRQATAFVPNARLPQDEDSDDGGPRSKAVAFGGEASVVDAASTCSSSGGRPVKQRVVTAFIRPGHLPAEEEEEEEKQDSRPRVKFGNDASIAEAASSGSGSGRSVKLRQATAFVPGAALPVEEDEDAGEDARPRVKFGADTSIGEAASSGSGRSVKLRQATAFVPGGTLPAEEDEDCEDSRPRVKFGADASIGETASSGGGRSVKLRQATAFVPGGALPAEEDEDEDSRPRVKFGADTSIGEAASSGSGRSVKLRQATAFVPGALPPEDDEDDAEDSRPRVKFGKDTSVGEAASGGSGSGRPVKQRQATAFVPGGGLPAEEDDDDGDDASGRKRPGVSFAPSQDAEEVDTPEGKSLRPTKLRQATCFVPKSQSNPEEDSTSRRVGFEAETSSVSVHTEQEQLRPTKSRQATSFVAKPPAVEEDGDEDEDATRTSRRRGVHFRDRDSVCGLKGMNEEEEEIEVPEEVNLRPSRVRQATAFAPPPQDDDDEDDEDMDMASPVAGGARSPKKREVSFSDAIEELKGADDGPGGTRPSRMRVPTSFVTASNLSQVSFGSTELDEDEDDDESQGGRRSTRTRLPTTFARAKALNYNESAANSEDEAVQEGELKEAIEAVEGGSSASDSPRRSPREVPDVDAHKVPDAPKEVEVIKTTLQSLYFFSSLDQQGYDALVSVMEVFEFNDGENITVQGNTQATHFFIVADGLLRVLRDGKGCADIQKGAAFGESVVLLSGAQNATVRAVGTARVYGMTGHAIRRTLRNRYHKEHKDASKQINELLKAGTCSLLHNLSPYQTQCLYDKGKLMNIVSGEYIVKEGEPVHAVHICVQGQLVLSGGSKKLLPPKRFGLLGEMGILDGLSDISSMAEKPSQTLLLAREALVDMFGERLNDALVRSRLVERLAQHHLFMGMSMEQLDVVADMAKIFSIPSGGDVQWESVFFMMCIHGSVEAEATPATGSPEKRQLEGLLSDGLGDESVSGPWRLSVTADGNSKCPARIAVWQSSGLMDILKQKALLEPQTPRDNSPSSPLRPSLKKMGSLRMAMLQDDKESALRKVVVLRTLSAEQLRKLALTLEVIHLKAGSVVFSQGEEGQDFYIIHGGHLSVLIGGKQVRTLGMGDYVGERALLYSEPRSATIEVLEDAELWKMNKESFMEVVKGPILDYMKDRIAFQNTRVEIDSLICLRIVGRGGFGVVKMVQSPSTRTRYALKCVNKKAAVAQKQQKALAVERSILAELDHPFVIKFVRSFLGKHYVYFLMELVTGGELLDALDKLGLLNKQQAQFYVASIALALEFLHERRIAYLDIKGENCLIDQHGYLKIIDFGIAERLQGGRIYAVKGTPLFMAPEVILGKGYTCSADLWSLGVCMYDFLAGRFPFGSDQTSNPEIFKAVLKAKLKFTKQIEKDPPTKDFLSGLLTRSPQARLGAGPEGYAAIKGHAFFEGFSWDDLLSRQLDPPFIPTCETYAEDQDNPDAAKEAPQTNPRMTVASGALSDNEEDGWVDPDPSWQEHF